MKVTIWAATLIAGLAAAMAIRPAVAADPVSGASKEQIEQIVRDYILKNPDVLIQSLQKYQEKQEHAAIEESQKAVTANLDAIERDGASPVAGNPKGDVTIVEFFDYHCGYCKRVLPSVLELLKADPNVRYVFRDFPILGPDSVAAAKTSLAVWRVAPNKYMDFHAAVLGMRGDLSDARVLEVVKKLGIDVDKVKKLRDDPSIAEQLEQNRQLADKLQINGTPAFIIGGKLIPGAVDLTAMKAKVADARAG